MRPSKNPVFANTAQTEADPGPLWASLFCNAIEPATEEGWLVLCEAGDWPHPRGMQRVSVPALNGMANDFNTLWERLKRRFQGVPIFVGHPDSPDFAGQPGHTDTKAYGWVKGMKVVGNQLWINADWSEDGQKIIKGKHYRFFSPTWSMRPLGNGNFEPARLKSIGLTNHPNIPGEAIANQQHHTMKMPEWMKKLLLKLGFSNEQVTALDSNAQGAPGEAEILAKYEAVQTAANAKATAETEKQTLTNQLTVARTEATNAKTEAQTNLTAFNNERAARIELLVSQGTRDGKIAPTESAGWSNEFKTNFEATVNKLQSAPVKLPTQGKEHAKDDKTAAANSKNKVEKIVEFTNAALPSCGNDWDKATAKVRREHPELFEEAK